MNENENKNVNNNENEVAKVEETKKKESKLPGRVKKVLIGAGLVVGGVAIGVAGCYFLGAGRMKDLAIEAGKTVVENAI